MFNSIQITSRKINKTACFKVISWNERKEKGKNKEKSIKITTPKMTIRKRQRIIIGLVYRIENFLID